MNKAELIGSIADKSGLSKADAGKALDALVDAITEALSDSELPIKERRVTLVGFGSFSVNRREARMGRNPSNNEAIQIAAKNVVKFKPGAVLSKTVN